MKDNDLPVVLDALDRKILTSLQQRGNISHADLAVEVGASQASCWRRIRALEEKGVLGPAVRLLDRERVGRGLDVLCQVRMKAHDREARRKFEAFAQQHDNIMECFSMSGEWDYLVRLVVGSVKEYEEILMQEILAQDVASSASHFSLKCVKYKTSIPL